MTKYTIMDKVSNENAHNTFAELLKMGVIPIVNENDTVATDELGIGDNDTLGAIVAKTIKADLLIILSDIDCLYTADPHKDKNAVLVNRVEDITDEIVAMTGGAGTALGTGGMVTKIKAAKIATAGGSDMVIANGSDPLKLYDIIKGESIGTRFIGKK